MNWEYSCGAVVFTRRAGQILYVIVQEQGGAYSFPKGHMEGNETEEQTARREIFEETGLHPEFLDGFRAQDEYALREKTGNKKRVTYVLAQSGDEPKTEREGENGRIQLLPYEQALALFEHETQRRILTAAHEFLTK